MRRLGKGAPLAAKALVMHENPTPPRLQTRATRLLGLIRAGQAYLWSAEFTAGDLLVVESFASAPRELEVSVLDVRGSRLLAERGRFQRSSRVPLSGRLYFEIVNATRATVGFALDVRSVRDLPAIASWRAVGEARDLAA